ncbi:hypothetical protein GYMLUDRAFT_268573 [Collybiopsis luxurians FD-317 M1]|nr:hypothetical protein GYMLUDRAFT_268573 [Collybiopsis luxurians FD-317 M1]
MAHGKHSRKSKRARKIGEEPRPNKHTHRAAWNEYFERDIARKYGRFQSNPSFEMVPLEDRADIIDAANSMGISYLNLEIAKRTREIIRAEGITISLAMEKMVYGNFEADWKELEVEKKKEIALEGLYRGACLAPRDNSRIACPEMTIEGLIGSGEFNLINLLKRLIAHDPAGSGQIQEIYLFEHPYTKIEYRQTEKAPDVVKAFAYYSILLRNWYIIATLQGALEAFYGMAPTPVIPIQNSSHKMEESGKFRERFKKSERHVDQSQCYEEAAIKSYACWTCNARTDDRTTLRKCSQCKLVWYCSSECQKKDWKGHKKFCGQDKFDPKLLSPTPSARGRFIGCPEPAPGFLRSPALSRQIWYLSKPDSINRDYHFNLEFARTRSLAVLNPWARLIFLVARRRAFASGSIPAVHKMFIILEEQQKAYGDGSEEGKPITLYQIRKQFEREYGTTITPETLKTAEAAWVPPTMEELYEERLYLWKRMELEVKAIESV